MSWYSFEPQDTLFFRGAEPSNMGESHKASAISPPPAHTLVGALRTAVLRQNDIDFNAYGHPDFDNTAILAAIGKAGEKCPFSLKGPFFMAETKLWVPCPYTWLRDKAKDENGDFVTIIKSEPLISGLVRSGSGAKLRFAKGDDLESLGGSWVSSDDLQSNADRINIKAGSAFYVMEPRTGIALDVQSRRTARRSHIYSFQHMRLLPDVKIVFAIDRPLPFAYRGVLKIGAEQRFGSYEKIADIALPLGTSGLFVALSHIEGDAKAQENVIATGRILYLGGWDMKKRYHKPMKGFYPAGTVFSKLINNNCIQI